MSGDDHTPTTCTGTRDCPVHYSPLIGGDELDLDAIEAQTRHRAQWGDDAHCAEMLALVAEVRRLRAQTDRLATLLGRRMTGPEIGAAISHGIETGAIELPAEGEPFLSGDEALRAMGFDRP